MNALADDLNGLLDRLPTTWDSLRGARIFITGGTGFFGSWLLESLCWANARLRLGCRAVVLTRDPATLSQKANHIVADPAIALQVGDVTTFDFQRNYFSHLIHAASPLSNSPALDPVSLLQDTARAAERVLSFAAKTGVGQMLYTSSGAVYGKCLPGRRLIDEDALISPPVFASGGAYAEAKRFGELYCTLAGEAAGIDVKLARGFAFAGPYLPLDGPLAVGNFIGDVLRGQDIVVKSAGTAVRSYLYGADLAGWLWTILTRGVHARPYNVGSDRPVSITEVAGLIAQYGRGKRRVLVAKPGTSNDPIDYYVPDITRARKELGLDVWTELPDAIGRTIAWYHNCRSLR